MKFKSSCFCAVLSFLGVLLAPIAVKAYNTGECTVVTGGPLAGQEDVEFEFVHYDNKEVAVKAATFYSLLSLDPSTVDFNATEKAFLTKIARGENLSLPKVNFYKLRKGSYYKDIDLIVIGTGDDSKLVSLPISKLSTLNIDINNRFLIYKAANGKLFGVKYEKFGGGRPSKAPCIWTDGHGKNYAGIPGDKDYWATELSLHIPYFNSKQMDGLVLRVQYHRVKLKEEEKIPGFTFN